MMGFTVVIELVENFKSLYGFGGRCLKKRCLYGFLTIFQGP